MWSLRNFRKITIVLILVSLVYFVYSNFAIIQSHYPLITLTLFVIIPLVIILDLIVDFPNLKYHKLRSPLVFLWYVFVLSVASLASIYPVLVLIGSVVFMGDILNWEVQLFLIKSFLPIFLVFFYGIYSIENRAKNPKSH